MQRALSHSHNLGSTNISLTDTLALLLLALGQFDFIADLYLSPKPISNSHRLFFSLSIVRLNSIFMSGTPLTSNV